MLAATVLTACTHFAPATTRDVDRRFQGAIGVDLGPSRSRVADGPSYAGLSGELAMDLTFWSTPATGFGLRGGWTYDWVELGQPGDTANRVRFTGYPISLFAHRRLSRRATVFLGAAAVMAARLEKVEHGVTTSSDPRAGRFTLGLRYTALDLPSISVSWTPFVEAVLTTTEATAAGNYESRALLFGAILRMRRCGGGCPAGQSL